MKQVYPIVAALVLFAFAGVAWGTHLKTEEAGEGEEMKGHYDVIYVDGEDGKEGDEAVIMDRRGDRYEFEPYEPGALYYIEKDVPADEALRRAREFLKKRKGYSVKYRRVLDERNATLGYDLSPQPDRFGAPLPNVLEINYRVGPDGKVRFELLPVPMLERPQ